MKSVDVSVPKLWLPKGGGAIAGIGETFQPNAFTRTAGLSIPIPTSPCRGFERTSASTTARVPATASSASALALPSPTFPERRQEPFRNTTTRTLLSSPTPMIWCRSTAAVAPTSTTIASIPPDLPPADRATLRQDREVGELDRRRHPLARNDQRQRQQHLREERRRSHCGPRPTRRVSFNG